MHLIGQKSRIRGCRRESSGTLQQHFHNRVIFNRKRRTFSMKKQKTIKTFKMIVPMGESLDLDFRDQFIACTRTWRITGCLVGWIQGERNSITGTVQQTGAVRLVGTNTPADNSSRKIKHASTEVTSRYHGPSFHVTAVHKTSKCQLVKIRGKKRLWPINHAESVYMALTLEINRDRFSCKCLCSTSYQKHWLLSIFLISLICE